MIEKTPLTIIETARALECSRSHVYHLIDRGLLHPTRNPIYRKGGPVRIPRAEVEALKQKGVD